jgi:hypothetical protein
MLGNAGIPADPQRFRRFSCVAKTSADFGFVEIRLWAFQNVIQL